MRLIHPDLGGKSEESAAKRTIITRVIEKKRPSGRKGRKQRAVGGNDRQPIISGAGAGPARYWSSRATRRLFLAVISCEAHKTFLQKWISHKPELPPQPKLGPKLHLPGSVSSPRTAYPCPFLLKKHTIEPRICISVMLKTHNAELPLLDVAPFPPPVQ